MATKTAHRKYWGNNPWMSHYQSARDRCNRKKNAHYHLYGGKGIKFLMTTKDFKFLWYRDKAYLMKQPSIDRINSKMSYTFDNCQFIEITLNRSKDVVGEKHPAAKLTEKDVLRMRELGKCRILSHGEIGRAFKVSGATALDVINRRSWRHI